MNKTFNLLVNQIRADIAAESPMIDAHVILANIIKTKWQGKKLNKRICDQFRAAMGLPESAVVMIDTTASLYHLVWWTSNYNDRKRLFLGYAADYCHMTVENFEERDNCNGQAAIDRNLKRCNLLNAGEEGPLGKLAIAVENLKAAQAEVDAITNYETGLIHHTISIGSGLDKIINGK